MSLPSVTRATLYVPSARAGPQVSLKTRKGSVGEAPRCFFWIKLICPVDDFIVVRHGGNAHRSVYCLLPLRRVARRHLSSLPQTRFFQCLSGWDPVYIQSTLSDSFPFPWGSQVLVWQPLPPCFHQAAQRDSHDLCRFFPRGCIFSMVKTIVCCLLPFSTSGPSL